MKTCELNYQCLFIEAETLYCDNCQFVKTPILKDLGGCPNIPIFHRFLETEPRRSKEKEDPGLDEIKNCAEELPESNSRPRSSALCNAGTTSEFPRILSLENFHKVSMII